jgi:hypothetical protein
MGLMMRYLVDSSNFVPEIVMACTPGRTSTGSDGSAVAVAGAAMSSARIKTVSTDRRRRRAGWCIAARRRHDAMRDTHADGGDAGSGATREGCGDPTRTPKRTKAVGKSFAKKVLPGNPYGIGGSAPTATHRVTSSTAHFAPHRCNGRLSVAKKFPSTQMASTATTQPYALAV